MAVNEEALNQAWNIVIRVLTPEKEKTGAWVGGLEGEVEVALGVLQSAGLAAMLQDWFMECLQQQLRQVVTPAFWQHFGAGTNGSSLTRAVDFLYEISMQYRPCIDALEAMLQHLQGDKEGEGGQGWGRGEGGGGHTLQVCHLLHHAPCLPWRWWSTVTARRSAPSTRAVRAARGETEGTLCEGCDARLSLCECQTIRESFHCLNRKLAEMGVLERVSGAAVTSIVHQQIQSYIDRLCHGSYDSSYLSTMEQWLDTKVLGWLQLVYGGQAGCQEGQESISAFRDRLLHFLYERYAQTLISQLFTIIIEFPESQPAILDLKVCLEKTDLRSQLVDLLRNALETRLLHPGVNTADILTAYISAIRALRVLDPAGVILDLVCEPVRKYLRSREDTVRCIVSSLTEDGSSELLEELVKGQPLVLDEVHSDDDIEGWEKWMPDPVDADPSGTSKSRRASDIISMLVNIYGSKELFVNEYRTLLADRILTSFNYDVVKELRYLELLKLRFGESQLHYCEVMLKDVADSKRINTRIVEEREQLGIQEDMDINAMILSAQFWPAFREEKITLPEDMQLCLNTFTKKFEALKGNRTLSWKPHLGLVTLDIELKENTVTFTCSPVHAAIILHFQEQARWTVEELSVKLQMSASALRRKITFWQSQGLLREDVPDCFVLVEEHAARPPPDLHGEEEEAESVMASAQEQREEELQMFWTYIVGMLTNLDCLPLERIHTMLRMFAMQGPTAGECSLQELRHFLDRKVKEQKLVYSGGLYRLARPS